MGWLEQGADPLTKKSSFAYEDLIECAKGHLFGPGNAQLPMPPMLMLDRITSISLDGGSKGRGHAVAEYDIKPDNWFFGCHFVGDPVMPGCLGLDGLWQLLGFFLGWTGAQGQGRALGVGEVKFTNQVTPEAKLVTFEIDLRRVVSRQITMGIANGIMKVDGETAYEASDMKVTLFGQPA